MMPKPNVVRSISASFLAIALLLVLSGCAGHSNIAAPPTGIEDVAEENGSGEVVAAEVDLYELLPQELETDPAAFEFTESRPAQEEEIVVDPAELVAEALELCESARIFWEEGDINEALTTLDEAYATMLEIPEDARELDQQKEDLRHLISQRVVEIYGSRLTSAVELGSPIPLDLNAHVEREIKSFQRGERKFFEESYRRSGAYRPMIVSMLRDAGMPEELSWLPLVESGFKTRAMSRARAMGMWQFISSTGYRYGLSRSQWIDERMDPEESTRAAIAYLTELHGMFGDWMTALAGYNCGENRVMRVIKRQEDEYLDHFWDVFEQLPRETARYVPRFLATLLIVSDPEKYGFDLPEPLPPVSFERVAVARHAKLDDLDRALGLDKGTLATLNPELRYRVTPGKAYELKVPPTAAPTFVTRLAEMPPYVPPESTYVTHRVRRGETLSTIARRHGSSVNSIVRANNLRSAHRISIGQRLKIPSRGATVRATTAIATGSQPASLKHTVRRGESLWKLASRYGTTVDRIKKDNGLRNDRLYVNQRLRINTGIPEGSLTYSVRRGDTVGKIARAHRVSINSVLRANGLSSSSKIYPGQALVIPN